MNKRSSPRLAFAAVTMLLVGASACSETDPIAPDDPGSVQVAAHGMSVLAAIDGLLPGLEDERLRGELATELGDIPFLIRSARMDELRPVVSRSRRRVKDALAADPNDADPVLAAVELILDYSAEEGER